MTRRTFGQSLAGGIMGVFARAWCPGALRAVEPVRVEPPRGTGTYRWIGAHSLDDRSPEFGDPRNWSPTGVPAYDDTIMFEQVVARRSSTAWWDKMEITQ